MTPKLQFFYLFVDKLMIGGIIGLVVYLAQRRLERFKGLQSFQMEIDKKRVEHIGAHWEVMNAWDTAVGTLITAFTQLILDHYSKPQGGSRLNDFVTPNLSTTIEVLRKVKSDPPAYHILRERCKSALDSLLAESRKQALRVSESIQVNRFWLGESMYKHCRLFQETLGKICVSFDNYDLDVLHREIIELKKLRFDVLQTIDMLHAQGTKHLVWDKSPEENRIDVNDSD